MGNKSHWALLSQIITSKQHVSVDKCTGKIVQLASHTFEAKVVAPVAEEIDWLPSDYNVPSEILPHLQRCRKTSVPHI